MQAVMDFCHNRSDLNQFSRRRSEGRWGQEVPKMKMFATTTERGLEWLCLHFSSSERLMGRMNAYLLPFSSELVGGSFFSSFFLIQHFLTTSWSQVLFFSASEFLLDPLLCLLCTTFGSLLSSTLIDDTRIRTFLFENCSLSLVLLVNI